MTKYEGCKICGGDEGGEKLNMADDGSDGNRFGYVKEMPDYDQTSLTPSVERDREGGLVENTEKRMNRRKWAVRGLGGASATAATAGVLDELGYIDVAEYVNSVTEEASEYLSDPQNVEMAAEASQYVSEIVTNLG